MSTKLETEELLGRLVAFDSVSRNSNIPLADFICDYLDGPGITIVRNPDEHGSKTNVVITRGKHRDNRRGLILSGHMDVVPADEDGWLSDPFEIHTRHGKLYGRGTADMKGFLAVAMNAMRDAGKDLAHPLVLLFTYDEELGTLGAHRFVTTARDLDILPSQAIIGEPTGLRAVRLHKGHLKLTIEFSGTAAHSGYPHLGVNAIEPAGVAIHALVKLRRELEDERHDYSQFYPDVPFVPLNVGVIAGGAAVNVIPDKCTLEVGIRPLPGTSSEAYVARVREVLTGALGDSTFAIKVVSDSPSLITDENAPLHQHLIGQVGQSHTASVSFATDAGWFQTVGMECVIFGPGTIEVAHKPNEYVPREDLARASDHLATAIRSFCKEHR